VGAPFSPVLLATDGSEAAAGAQRVAIAMAQRCGAQLAVLTMVISNPETEAMFPDLVRKSEEQAREILADASAAARAAGVEPETLVRRGDEPPDEIVAAAGAIGAQLIVIGRRGKRGLMRRLMGSTTAQVIGHAACPVLVVPRICQLPSARVLLTTDGSTASDAAATVAASLAAICGLPVTVLSVSPLNRSAERHAETQAIVERTVALMRERGADAAGMVAEGREHEAIVAAGRETGADLIVMGSHGRTGLRRLLMGSTTERVIGLSQCPVLVTIAPGDAAPR
jgi:nucleotide-binding universal stress UspA family protein